jgi:hypothetical protein
MRVVSRRVVLLLVSDYPFHRTHIHKPPSLIPFGASADIAGAPPGRRGPKFIWRAEDDELHLQSLFPPQPQLLDVELIMDAAKRALAVCRVEVGAGQKGTGVLVGSDLVLTDYHMVGGDLESRSRPFLRARRDFASVYRRDAAQSGMRQGLSVADLAMEQLDMMSTVTNRANKWHTGAT